MSSQQSATPGSGPERRIALIKPSADEEQASHAVQLFDSVLWVFKGTTRSSWVTTPAAAADIIVVHHSEPASNLARWRGEGKHIVVLSTDDKKHPAGPRTLVYPFAAVKVLSMLEHVEAEMESNTTVAPPATPVTSTPSKPRASSSNADPWSFVESLRTLRTVNNSALWLMCKGPQGPFLWIRGDVASYYCDAATAAAIRAGTLDMSGLSLQKGTPPPGNLPARLGEELFWFATYHASASLAPWLNDKTTYRLVRWPDLGRLRASDAAERTAQIRVIATLAAGPSALGRFKANIDATARTLNALASCALIETSQPAPPAPKVAHAESSVPTPIGGVQQFLRSMRKRLGLGGNS